MYSKHSVLIAVMAFGLLATDTASMAGGRHDVQVARIGVDISMKRLAAKACSIIDTGGDGFSQLAFIPSEGMETMEIFPVEGWDEKTGLAVSSTPSYSNEITPGVAYLRKMTIPEGLPACQICFSVKFPILFSREP